MRSVTVSIPLEGTTLVLKPQHGAKAEAIVVVPEGVEVSVLSDDVRSAESQAAPRRATAPTPDTRYIVDRLRKLKVKTEAAAINSIKAMFQFTEPLDDQGARKRLSEAQRKGFLKVDAAGKISFTDA